jgi:putative copper export protein
VVLRFLHLIAMAFFVGGQLVLAISVVPAVRRHGSPEAMLAAARRFGTGSAVALAVLIATGVAMATDLHRWGSSVLHAKLGVLALVIALIGLHVVVPQSRRLAWLTLAASLVIVWLGVRLAHG